MSALPVATPMVCKRCGVEDEEMPRRGCKAFLCATCRPQIVSRRTPRRGLTEVEFDILLGVVEGETVVEIAERRGTRPETVRVQRRRIREKLGARTSEQAVANAYHQGILTAPS